MTESVAETNRLKRRRYRQHGNPFTIRAPKKMPDWNEIYGRKAPLALDIGFGEGGFTTELARNHPEWNVLGLEIRPHFVKWLMEARHEHRLNNLYGIVANANEHLGDLLENGSVEFVSINFPDPWSKKARRKHRIISERFLEMMHRLFRPNGEIHFKTDHREYFQYANDLLVQSGLFRILDHTVDLQQSKYAETNIRTEFEMLFASKKNPPIGYLRAGRISH
mgnify:CR=1 FL=1